HIPPAVSSWRTTGSLNRGSGSVKRGSVMGILLGSGRAAAPRKKETRQPLQRFRRNSAFREPKDQVMRIASRHAAQKMKKKQARKTGRLATGDQCSTVRPTR